MPTEIQRVTTRCWGITGYGYQCGHDSTHVVSALSDSRGRVTVWSCRQHIAQIGDYVQRESGQSVVQLSAIAWHAP